MRNGSLVGGDYSDVLNAGEDADILEGDLGEDLHCRGAGSDDLDGGGGADTLLGGVVNDTAQGGDGVDFLGDRSELRVQQGGTGSVNGVRTTTTSAFFLIGSWSSAATAAMQLSASMSLAAARR